MILLKFYRKIIESLVINRKQPTMFDLLRGPDRSNRNYINSQIVDKGEGKENLEPKFSISNCGLNCPLKITIMMACSKNVACVAKL